MPGRGGAPAFFGTMINIRRGVDDGNDRSSEMTLRQFIFVACAVLLAGSGSSRAWEPCDAPCAIVEIDRSGATWIDGSAATLETGLSGRCDASEERSPCAVVVPDYSASAGTVFAAVATIREHDLRVGLLPPSGRRDFRDLFGSDPLLACQPLTIRHIEDIGTGQTFRGAPVILVGLGDGDSTVVRSISELRTVARGHPITFLAIGDEEAFGELDAAANVVRANKEGSPIDLMVSRKGANEPLGEVTRYWPPPPDLRSNHYRLDLDCIYGDVIPPRRDLTNR